MLAFIHICICIFKHLYESLSCDLIESFERTVLLLILTCLWSSFIISLFLFSFFVLLIADHCVHKIRSSRSLMKNNFKISYSCPGRAYKLILKTDLRLERRRYLTLKQSIRFCRPLLYVIFLKWDKRHSTFLWFSLYLLLLFTRFIITAIIIKSDLLFPVNIFAVFPSIMSYRRRVLKIYEVYSEVSRNWHRIPEPHAFLLLYSDHFGDSSGISPSLKGKDTLSRTSEKMSNR